LPTILLLCKALDTPNGAVEHLSLLRFNQDSLVLAALYVTTVFEDATSRALHFQLTDEKATLVLESTNSQAMWAYVSHFIGNDPILTLDYHTYEQSLSQLMQDAGYSALSEDSRVDLSWLARLALPRLASYDLQTVSQALGLPDSIALDCTEQSYANHVLQLFCAVSARFKKLPLVTLQTIGLATLKNRALQSLLNEWQVAKFGIDLAVEDDWRVIDLVAFRPAVRNQSQERGRQHYEDSSDEVRHAENGNTSVRQTAKSLAIDSLKLLQTGLASTTEFVLEQRPGQVTMLGAVASTLWQGGQLVVEAGTGTGKSLAYLLPAALFAKQTGKRVVVSTHTIALQEQLRQKDLTLLERAAPGLAVTAILKGRTHYLCMRKLSLHGKEAGALPDAERDATLRLLVWLTETETGDREEVSLSQREQPLWNEVQSETESCIHKRCVFFRDCYYFRARAVAANADIVVTNHSLVLSDLASEHSVLPPFSHVIIDEAHHLEDQATKQLGAEISVDGVRRILDRLAGPRGLVADLRRSFTRMIGQGHEELNSFVRWSEQSVRLSTEVQQAIVDTEQVVLRWAGRVSCEKRIGKVIQESASFSSVRTAGETLYKLERELAALLAELETLRTGIELDDSLYGRTEDAAGSVRELRSALGVAADVLLARSSEDAFVGWVSIRAIRTMLRLSLHLAPLSVAAILRDQLFQKKDTVICTSATLSVAGDFSYFAERTGLNSDDLAESARTLVVQSPFHYKKQALLCVPTDLPEVKDANFEQATGRAIRQIASDAGGRTLVLFTSNQMLSSVYHAERQALLEAGLRVFAQGIADHRRTQLVDAFRNEERGVLFGVNSFWEGIDIPGDDLRCLIIVKLPFAVPTHPVAQARGELLTRAGHNPFRDYSIPQAIIRFTQGFGRLIRTERDRGTVFVLDKRIVTTSYGQLFLSSLPGPTVHTGPLSDLRKKALAFFPD